MALENCREYLRQLKEDVKNEGEGQCPLLVDGFVRQIELFVEALDRDMERK